MINRKYRISKGFFPKILKNPSISGEYFRVVVAPPISSKNPNFAVIIAKKQGKLAVTRNSYKRAVFEAVSEKIETFPLKSFIFIMKKTLNIKEIAKNEILKDINNLISLIIKKYGKN